jgi:hypothetical protein
MASETTHWGLQKLRAGDPLSTNDYAFTERNMDRLDTLLHRAIEHDHTGNTTTVSDPTDPLDATLESTGGNIPGGRQVRYKFTWVDEYGAESSASPEVVVSTPSPISSPGQPTPTVSSSGGTLLPGNYFYALSAYKDANTNETPVGSRGYVTILSGSTNEIVLTLPTLPSGADGFNVYRRAPGETAFSYLASVDMTVATPPTSYTDDGSTSPNCNRLPVNTNLTNSTNAITLEIPGATPVIPEGYTWKIYRTYEAGNYATSLLAWVVEETSEGSGIITTEYVDVGIDTAGGTPPTTSELVDGPEKISLTDLEEVQGTLPPYYNVIPHVVTFAQSGVLEDGEGSFLWVCEFDEAEVQYVRCALGRNSVASSDVIVDVNRYESQAATPGWDTIFTTQANRPRVLAGETFGEVAEPDEYVLVRGDALTIDIDDSGNGATPTAEDLVVNIFLIVRSAGTRDGVGDNSYAWTV